MPDEVTIETRYDIPGNPRLVPQTDAKTALASAIKAIETGRYDYLVAHLMDRLVEGRIDDRALHIERAVKTDLRALRDRQSKMCVSTRNSSVDGRLRLPSV